MYTGILVGISLRKKLLHFLKTVLDSVKTNRLFAIAVSSNFSIFFFFFFVHKVKNI